MTGYTPKTWVNDGAPAISAANLQAMDDGIEDAHDEIQLIEDDINYPSTVKQKAIVDSGEDGGVEGGVFNGDFEYGIGTVTDDGWIGAEKYGWYADRDATAISVSYDAGKLKLSNTDGTGSSSVKNVSAVTLSELSKNASPMIVSTPYRLSCKIKTDNVAADAAFLSMEQYDTSAVIGTTITLTKVTGDSDETYYESIFTSDADAAYAVFEAHNDVAGNVSDAWFDNIKLEQIDTQTVNTQIDELASVQIEGVTTTANVDQFLETSGQSYTLTTGINEGATHRQTFTPVADRGDGKHSLTKMQVLVAAVGTGDWILTVHDASNTVLASLTIVNGSMSTGDVDFDVPAILDVGTAYHFHITSTVADGTVTTTTLNDLETVDYHAQFAKHTESPIIEANGSSLDLTGVKLLTGAKVTVNADGSGRYLHDSGDLRTFSNALAFANDIYYATDGDGDSWAIDIPFGIGINNWVFDDSFGILNNNTVTAEWIAKYEFGYVAKEVIVKFIGENEASNRHTRIEYSHDMLSWNVLFDAGNTPIDPSFAISEYGHDVLYMRISNGDTTEFVVSLQLSIDANLDCQAELPIFAPSSEVSSETQDLVLNPIDISEDGFWQLKYDLTGWGSRTITMVADEATWEAQAVSADTIYVFDSNGTGAWTWDARNGLVPPTDRTSGAVMAKFLVGDNQIRSSVNDGSMKANVNLSWTESSIRSSLNYVKDKVNSLLDLTKLKILNVWGQKSVTYDGSNPPANGIVNGVPVMDFDDTTDEIIYMADIHLPSDYDPATDLKVYGTFVMDSATSGDVVLDLEYMTIGANENISSTAWTNLESIVTVPSTAGFRAGISFTIPSQDFDASSDTLALKLFRDTSEDGASGDLRLIKLYLIYDGEVI